MLIMACAAIFASMPSLAQKTSQAETPIPTVRFNAANPFDKVNLRTQGTPWQAADHQTYDLPKEIKEAVPEPLPDLKNLSLIQYNAAVSVAFESLRIVYGELSEAEAKAFSDMWTPLFNCPTDTIVGYLNKLNPLLSQFLVARENFCQTLSDIDLLLMDAREAVSWSDKDAYNEAVGEAATLTRYLKRLEKGMKVLASRIEALGNPPNPLAERAEARRLYDLGLPKKEYGSPGEAWMGLRERSELCVRELPSLQEPLFRHLFKAKINGESRYLVIELGETRAPTKDEIRNDPNALDNIKIIQRMYGNRGNERPDFKSDARFYKFMPDPPKLLLTTTTMKLLAAFSMSESDPTFTRENPSLAQDMEDYHNAAGNYGNRILRAGSFFKAAMQWAYKCQWDKYDIAPDGELPQEALDDFAEAVREVTRKELALQKKSKKERKAAQEAEAAAAPPAAPLTPEQIAAQQQRDSLELDRQAKLDRIAEIEAEIAQNEKLIEACRKDIATAPSRLTPENAQYTIGELNRQIISLYSENQHNRDLINGMRTGEFHRTRTVADEFNHNYLVNSIKENADRHLAVKRALPIIERQIERLPKNEQQTARKRYEDILENSGAIASDDFTKVRKFAKSLNNTLTGHALADQARQEIIISNNDIYEFSANCTVMAATSLVGGGVAYLAHGTRAALLAPKAFGAIYSGVTGYISGGPTQAIKSSISSFGPLASMAVTYVDTYRQLSATSNDHEMITQQALQAAGEDGLKSLAIGILTSGATKLAHAYGPRMCTKPVISKSKPKSVLDPQTLNQIDMARKTAKAFKEMNAEYASMKANGASKAQLDAKMKDIDHLAAQLNGDYHAKWYYKYKAEKADVIEFDNAVQRNYNRMIPVMESRLKAQGYDMTDIRFRQFRNASSAGSSSMDLDLAPVSATTGKEPRYFKNGKEVTPNQFRLETQDIMDQVYHEQHGISTKASEMNFVNSSHPEAFGTTDLLRPDVDFSQISAKNLSSVGDVLHSKVSTIQNNMRMTATTKLQAQCRETSKEVKNMLLKMLNQKLRNLGEELKLKESNKVENLSIRKQIDDYSKAIKRWEKIGAELEYIGTKAETPTEIHRANQKLMDASGGKNIHQIVFEVMDRFNPTYLQDPANRISQPVVQR